jgi:hypothetical protein
MSNGLLLRLMELKLRGEHWFGSVCDNSGGTVEHPEGFLIIDEHPLIDC